MRKLALNWHIFPPWNFNANINCIRVHTEKKKPLGRQRPFSPCIDQSKKTHFAILILLLHCLFVVGCRCRCHCCLAQNWKLSAELIITKLWIRICGGHLFYFRAQIKSKHKHRHAYWMWKWKITQHRVVLNDSIICQQWLCARGGIFWHRCHRQQY